ncbi:MULTISPECIES: DUF2934 domain-containing protein [unclassified Methylobacterium]|uniref:DUF2934 domain-containing protein n=1 Tax=unclassified Methylobacterium TaxID=2615210 RepID=UPI00226AF775|nr:MULTISPECIES: DUF2934 domain-containing protein [unclassified Methylobacterium]
MDREIRDRACNIWERHNRPKGFEIYFLLTAKRDLSSERRAEKHAGADPAPGGQAPDRRQRC